MRRELLGSAAIPHPRLALYPPFYMAFAIRWTGPRSPASNQRKDWLDALRCAVQMLGKGYADVVMWTLPTPVSFAVVVFKGIKCLTHPPDGPPETTRFRYERRRKCTFCSCWGLASLGRELRHLDLQPNRSQPLGLEQVLWSRRGCCPSFLPS